MTLNTHPHTDIVLQLYCCFAWLNHTQLPFQQLKTEGPLFVRFNRPDSWWSIDRTCSVTLLFHHHQDAFGTKKLFFHFTLHHFGSLFDATELLFCALSHCGNVTEFVNGLFAKFVAAAAAYEHGVVYPIWRRHLFRLWVHPEGDVNVTCDRSAVLHATEQDMGGGASAAPSKSAVTCCQMDFASISSIYLNFYNLYTNNLLGGGAVPCWGASSCHSLFHAHLKWGRAPRDSPHQQETNLQAHSDNNQISVWLNSDHLR